MKCYVFNEIKDKGTYVEFIRYMLANSDAFSLVYFKYRENEWVRRTVKKTKRLLEPYLIYSHIGNEWPAMATANQFGHIHDISLYRADANTEKALCSVNSVFDWDYPKYPMDLCFFRDGYGWFACCSHEQFACLYTDDEQIVRDIEKIGINLGESGSIPVSELFYDEKSKLE